MLDLPRPGIQSMSPALAGGFFTTEPPGKSPPTHLDHFHLSATFSAWWKFTKVWGMNKTIMLMEKARFSSVRPSGSSRCEVSMAEMGEESFLHASDSQTTALHHLFFNLGLVNSCVISWGCFKPRCTCSLVEWRHSVIMEEPWLWNHSSVWQVVFWVSLRCMHGGYGPDRSPAFMESTVWEGMCGQEALKQIRRGLSTKKRCTTWEFQVKFYLGQNEDCSPVDSTSDSSEELLRRGRGGRLIYVILVKGKFNESSTYFTFLLVTNSWYYHEGFQCFSRYEEVQRLGSWSQFLKTSI